MRGLLNPVPWLVLIGLPGYAIWQWRLWFTTLGPLVPRSRGATFVGLCLATCSTALCAFLIVHAMFTGGYPYYHPIEMFFLGLGCLSAFLGFVCVVVAPKGKLSPHIAILSVMNSAIWFMDAVRQ